MPDFSDEAVAPRAVWRRSVTTPSRAAVDEVPLRCGGPTLTVDERFELMRAKKREMDEAKVREREVTEAREVAGRPVKKTGDEEDEAKAAERFRNDRYSVTLLSQDTAAWGGDGSEPGMLG